MNYEWRKVEGFIEPLEIDDTISDEYIYIRKNIEKFPIIDTKGNDTGNFKYKYLEKTMTYEDWKIYQNYKQIDDNKEAIILIEQSITDIDLRDIEREQAVTDMDLRILELELGG